MPRIPSLIVAAFEQVVMVPAQQTVLIQLCTDYVRAVARRSDGAKAGAEAAAGAMLTARTHDGRGDTPGTFVRATPGAWRPTPPIFQQDSAVAWVAPSRLMCGV